MALQKNKIYVEGTTYEIAQSEQANILLINIPLDKESIM